MVDNFQAKYAALSIPYPADQGTLAGWNRILIFHEINFYSFQQLMPRVLNRRPQLLLSVQLLLLELLTSRLSSASGKTCSLSRPWTEKRLWKLAFLEPPLVAWSTLTCHHSGHMTRLSSRILISVSKLNLYCFSDLGVLCWEAPGHGRWGTLNCILSFGHFDDNIKTGEKIVSLRINREINEFYGFNLLVSTSSLFQILSE